MQNLNDHLIKGKPTPNSILELLKQHPGPKITIKAQKKLLEVLKESMNSDGLLSIIAEILLLLSRNTSLINQIVDQGPVFSSILDKMLSYASSSRSIDGSEQLMLIVVYDLISISQKLKSQLCMSIHEYLLTSIEQSTLHPSLLSKAMELLVCTVTHHQENRIFFAQNTSRGKISAVFNLILTTGNPMVQIFSVEFLWRIVLPMKPSNEFKTKIFGQYGNQLCSITADNFRDGILDFIKTINLERRDNDRIVQCYIKKVMIGNNLGSGKHTLYIGSDTILLWISKNTEFSMGDNDLELITLKSENISGFGSNEKYWAIGITKDFDTLTEYFMNDDKMIVFIPIDPEPEMFNIAQQRYGTIPFRTIPKPKIKNMTSLTPKPKKSVETKAKSKTKSATPKVKSDKVRVLKPKTPQKQSKTPLPKQIFYSSGKVKSTTPTKSSKRVKNEIIEILSDNSDEIETNENNFNQLINIKKEPKVEPIEEVSTSKPKIIPSINIKKESKQKNESKQPKNNEQDEESLNELELDDDVPIANISQSFDLDESDDSEDPFSQPEQPLKQEEKVEIQQTNVTSIPSPKIQQKRRLYTPERWELETFDELRSFGNAIKTRLSEKRTLLNKAIDDKITESLKEVNEFMLKCDGDLEALRTEFIDKSSRISEEIRQKQETVAQLGEQQSEHIQQMIKDCQNIQKKAEEIIAKFTQQKKSLLANQEKHINLFREDIKSEVKSAFTNKKRESSKMIVQKLVTLLDEL
ncbi:hypothetical protein GPJ56_006366 [Histomonas meleagridis]|uniref:uncharacterized protein n=1 Tax=Histomonas meleagridis TaxID=135588 RepID=UPI003559C5FB|nr:hypothetical protein GPJ56_006366 [Histomonas meleagridis]KAH0796817.1 hypothetical protein GO595_010710 [Histomonas meleagridis]